MSSFNFNADGMVKGLNTLLSKTEMAVMMYAETASKQLEGHAKVNAPWTDRTGAARNRLRSYTEHRPRAIRIVLAHGVSYGIWLELANEKRFAIIQPTIDLKSGEVFAGLKNLFNRMGVWKS